MTVSRTQAVSIKTTLGKGLTSLKKLDLGARSQVTDAGLANLKGLTELQELRLRGRGVTDAGLVQLKGLRKLQTLYLCMPTRVTDEGVENLQ